MRENGEPASSDLVERLLCDTHAAMDSGLPRGRVVSLPGLEVRVSGLDSPILNMAACARLGADDADAGIRSSLEIFDAARVPFYWWVTPASEPSDVAERLARRGLVERERFPAMRLDVPAFQDPPETTGLTTRRVTTPSDLNAFLKVFQESFGVPEDMMPAWRDAFGVPAGRPETGLRAFLGIINGEPVASGVVFVGARGAALHSIGTIPSIRRRQIGTAMTTHLVREARTAGARTIVLESTSDGHPLYRRMGFRDIGDFVAYSR